MDVLQEGGAGQFRDPLTVKLMPEATSQGGGRLGSELADWAVPSLPYPRCPQRDAALFLCWALQRQSLTAPGTTLCTKDKGAPFYRGH